MGSAAGEIYAVSTIGGVAGILVTSFFLVPRLGSAAALCFVIAGQILAALLIEQFGLFGLALRDISWGRALGATLVVLGAVMVRLL